MEKELQEFVLPDGIEIPEWLDIDGDGEISQEEFEVFLERAYTRRKVKEAASSGNCNY